MTRPTADDRPPEVQETASRDFPVDHEGRFDPGARPELWPLRLSWRWEPGHAKEAEAIEQWRRCSSHTRWLLAGSPWARSDWEQDPAPWTAALAAL